VQHLLLVDLGGSSLKVGLCRLDGKIGFSVHVMREFDEDSSGNSEKDPEVWWESLIRACKDLLGLAPEDFRNIIGIVICGITRTQVFLDHEGQSLRPAITFRDRRAVAQVEQALKKTRVREHKSAQHFNVFHPLARLLWLKENEPDHWKKLAYVIEPKDYLNFKLTGVIASDPISQFWLNQAQQQLCSLIGLNIGELIPPLYQPYQAIGTVQARLPRFLKQLHGVPVFCGGPDTWTAAAGLGALKPGCGYGISGSSEVFGLISNTPAEAEGLITIPWGDHLWQIGGPGQNGANALNWIVEQYWAVPQYESWVVKQFEQMQPPFPDKIDKLLSHQSQKPLLFYPFLHGERTPFWDSNLTGAFLGLTSAHQPGDQVRAVMEGVAFLNRFVLEKAEIASGQRAQEIRLAGGGTRNAIWNQIRANVLGRPLLVASEPQMGWMGALALARYGLGKAEKITIDAENNFKIYEPQPDKVAFYEALYRIFKANLPMNTQISHDLNALARRVNLEGKPA